MPALRRRAGFALIELLVAIVIIALLAAVFYGLWGKKKGEKSTPAQAKDKASGVECQSNLRQLRMAIDMESQGSGEIPAAIPSGMESISKCPISGQPYTYDPATGRVGCGLPEHQEF